MIEAKDIQPMNGYVLLRSGSADKSEGGIFLPDQAKEKHRRRKPSVVVAVSEGEVTQDGKLVEPRVRVGDQVWLTQNATVEVSNDFPDHAFVHQRDILCRVKDAGGSN